jgi:endonuclease YncB( thermonuclease family)
VTILPPWLAVAPPLPADLLPAGGTDWNQCAVARAVDGDTARVLRRRVTAKVAHHDDIGGLLLQEWAVHIVEDDGDDLPGGLAGRLITLDTPERGQDGYALARADLEAFVELAGGGLRCFTYDRGGGFDRLLIDLYYVRADGTRHTATEWMLARGWKPYVR